MLKEILKEYYGLPKINKDIVFETGKSIPKWVLEFDKHYLWLDLNDDIKKALKKYGETGEYIYFEYDIKDGKVKGKTKYRIPVKLSEYNLKTHFPLYNVNYIEKSSDDYVLSRVSNDSSRFLDEEYQELMNYVKKETDIEYGNVINVYKV